MTRCQFMLRCAVALPAASAVFAGGLTAQVGPGSPWAAALGGFGFGALVATIVLFIFATSASPAWFDEQIGPRPPAPPKRPDPEL